MEKIIEKIVIISDRLTNILSSVFMAATFLLVFLNVVLRYCFNSGFAWAEEGARYLFVCMVFMGCISVTEKRQNFQVTIFLNKAKGIVKKIMLIVQDIVIAVMLYIMGSGAIQMAKLNWYNKSPAIGLPYICQVKVDTKKPQ